ncbi:MAG: hypothetical protein ABR981_01445 [Candidatus Micrarchaeaceae archaeon]|jgi:hypothetical protein
MAVEPLSYLHTTGREQLILAVRIPDLAKVHELLHSPDADKNTSLANGFTDEGNPIFFEIIKVKDDGIRNAMFGEFISVPGFDLNLTSRKFGLNALHQSAMFGSEHISRKLVEMGVIPAKDKTQPEGRFPSDRARERQSDGKFKDTPHSEFLRGYEQRNGSAIPPQQEKQQPVYKPTNRGRKMKMF